MVAQERMAGRWYFCHNPLCIHDEIVREQIMKLLTTEWLIDIIERMLFSLFMAQDNDIPPSSRSKETRTSEY